MKEPVSQLSQREYDELARMVSLRKRLRQYFQQVEYEEGLHNFIQSFNASCTCVRCGIAETGHYAFCESCKNEGTDSPKYNPLERPLNKGL